MLAYVILIAVFLISYFFFKRHYDQEKTVKYMITTFFVGYLVLLCFRDFAVGIDNVSYINMYFIPLRNTPWREVFVSFTDEPGFSVIAKVIVDVFEDNHLVLAIIALMSVIPLMILYRRESKEAAVCCSFFMISLLFEIFFSGLRQGIALGLTVPAYYFTKHKKFIPFLLMVLLASSIHTSAFMLLLLYPVYHAKITGKWLWVVVPAMAVVYIFNDRIFSVVFNALATGKYFEKYASLTRATNQYGLLVLFVLISAYSILVMDKDSADKDDIGLRNLLLLATTLQFFAPLHALASRLNYYFIMFIPIAITRVNFRRKPQYDQVVRIASFIMAAFFIFYFFFMKGDSLQIMDYKPFF